MKNFEVEMRSLLSKKHHDFLKKKFDQIAKGDVDDAKTYTFLTSTINIKVKNRTTKNKAKITVKKGAEYAQQADETELPIDPKDVGKAVELITALGYTKHIPSMQRRIDYVIDGIHISLKHETNWGYHIEAEIQVKKEKNIKAAKEKILTFFKSLEITPMTEEENRELINSVLIKYDIELI